MMMVTYSGIVPISGSIFETTTTGIFPTLSFDTGFDSVDEVDKEGNFRTEISILTPDIFFAGVSGSMVPVIFDTIGGTVDEVERENNFRTEITVLSPDIFFSGGIFEPVIFDTRNSVDQVEKEANSRTEITFINSKFDFSFAPLTTATGITVVNFGFNTVGGFVTIPRTNRRIFPVPVEDATLFPGDRPRGSPLN